MTLRQDGDYWYGDCPEDVWEYFVWRTRNSPEPVGAWKHAVCDCGGSTFEMELDDVEQFARRTCAECGHEGVILSDPPASRFPEDCHPRALFCICGMDEFEVIGVTAPYQDEPGTAEWFYLGIRCDDCGCLGCYSDGWLRRETDAAALLSLL